MVPGLKSVTGAAQRVLSRFPLAMLAALIGTVSAVLITHMEPHEDKSFLGRLLMASVLGVLLYIDLQLLGEREAIKTKVRDILLAGASLALIVYGWQLPADFSSEADATVIRFMIMVFILLFGLVLVPFVRHPGEANGFWQYSKTLFIRAFLTFIYTGSLFLGLVLALAGADQLLGFEFGPRIIPELWMVVFGLVSTSFFLAGIPEKTAELEMKTDYHRGIEIFAKFILIPLLSIYALILYVYTGKILVSWNWPEGMVSWLIIVFSLGTILANFLLRPLLNKERWILFFTRLSFALVVPMTVVMALAMKIRVDDYGVTVPRYYGLVLCAWILGMALYFIFSKKRNTLIVPLSAAILAVISLAGPLSSINISTWSQMGRLKSVLVENSLLIGGRAQKTETTLEQKDLAVIHGSLNYLIDLRGFSIIQPWFTEDLAARKESSNCYRSQCVTELLGLSQVSELAEGGYRYLRAEETMPLSVERYRGLLPFYLSNWEGDGVLRFIGGGYNLSLNPSSGRLTITEEGERMKTELDIIPLIETLKGQNLAGYPWYKIRIDTELFGVVFRQLDYSETAAGEIERVNGGSGYLLIR